MKFSGGQAMTQTEVKALLKAPTAQAAMIFLLGLVAFGYSTLVVLRGDITESARIAATALGQDARALSLRSKALAAAAKAAEEEEQRAAAEATAAAATAGRPSGGEGGEGAGVFSAQHRAAPVAAVRPGLPRTMPLREEVAMQRPRLRQAL